MGRVVVLGSINVDLVATADRLPLPGETVAGTGFSVLHGGKGANQAVAASRAGASVVLRGAVGGDAFADAAVDALVADGIDVLAVDRVGGPTGVAVITVDAAGENTIVVVAGANALADGRGVQWRPGDVASAVLEVPLSAVRQFFAEARAGGATTVLNAAPVTDGAAELLSLVDVLCVNETELAALGDVSPDALVVTLGSAGVLVVAGGVETRVTAHSVDVVDTVGAGDATCGYLVAGLASGLDLVEAVRWANAAGAMTVRAVGARTSPTAVEVEEFMVDR